MPRLIEPGAVGKGHPCAKLAPVLSTADAAGRAIPSESPKNPPKLPRVCACSPFRSRVTGVVLSFRTDFCPSLLPILVQPARRDAAALSPSPGPSTSPPARSPALSPASDTAHRLQSVPSPVPSPVPSLRHRTSPPACPQPGPQLRHRAVPRSSRAASRVCRGKVCKALQVSWRFFISLPPPLSLFNSVSRREV